MIPAWNEEDRLGRTLNHYLPVLTAVSETHEVLVVVDGVMDRTAEVAARYATQGVRVILHPTKLGKGGATLMGLRDCQFDVIGFVDADSSLSAQELADLVFTAGLHGCAIGSRQFTGPARGSGTRRPLSRKVLSALWRIFVRVLFRMPIQDTQCGAKFFRRDRVTPVLDTVEVTDWAFDVSLLYHIRRAAIPIVEVPVVWTHESGSKIRVVRVTAAMFMSAIGLRVANSPLRGLLTPPLVRRLRSLVSQV